MRLLIILALLPVALACSRPLPSGAAAPLPLPPPPRPQTPTAPMPTNATAQPSEFVATNKADPNCPTCRRGDATNGPVYHRQPDMPLDEVTLADVRATLDATNALLEDGVAILEKHKAQPDKALDALQTYRKNEARRIAQVFGKAKEVKARLKAAGYVEDIPAEVQPYAEQKMRTILQRLDAVRGIYRTQPAVLESFGALFPRGD
jgi:hypothetical protein